jgi:hypothetical protein
MFFRLQQMINDNASINAHSFVRAWNAWIEFNKAQNTWSDTRFQWHKSYGDRYFKEYFGDKKLDQVTSDFADGYWVWRQDFWINGVGAKRIDKNPRRRNAKSQGSHNAKKSPSNKTLQMEQVSLNQFFRWVFEKKRWMRFSVTMKFIGRAKEQNEGRRATFDQNEWQMIIEGLDRWSNKQAEFKNDRLNDYHRHQRRQLRAFVLFIAGTGIRPGTETRFMKWEDITFFMDEDGIEKASIRIRQHTKKGVQRNVIAMPMVVDVLKQWRQISRYNGDQHFIWYGQSKANTDQAASSDLNKTFQDFLKRIEYKGRADGLLYDGDERRRSLYSLRHFYATERVLSGVEYETLRKNMGTGILQLQRHYDWVETRQKSIELTKTRSSNRIRRTQENALTNE